MQRLNQNEPNKSKTKDKIEDLALAYAEFKRKKELEKIENDIEMNVEFLESNWLTTHYLTTRGELRFAKVDEYTMLSLNDILSASKLKNIEKSKLTGITKLVTAKQFTDNNRTDLLKYSAIEIFCWLLHDAPINERKKRALKKSGTAILRIFEALIVELEENNKKTKHVNKNSLELKDIFFEVESKLKDLLNLFKEYFDCSILHFYVHQERPGVASDLLSLALDKDRIVKLSLFSMQQLKDVLNMSRIKWLQLNKGIKENKDILLDYEYFCENLESAIKDLKHQYDTIYEVLYKEKPELTGPYSDNCKVFVKNCFFSQDDKNIYYPVFAEVYLLLHDTIKCDEYIEKLNKELEIFFKEEKIKYILEHTRDGYIDFPGTNLTYPLVSSINHECQQNDILTKFMVAFLNKHKLGRSIKKLADPSLMDSRDSDELVSAYSDGAVVLNNIIGTKTFQGYHTHLIQMYIVISAFEDKSIKIKKNMNNVKVNVPEFFHNLISQTLKSVISFHLFDEVKHISLIERGTLDTYTDKFYLFSRLLQGDNFLASLLRDSFASQLNILLQSMKQHYHLNDLNTKQLMEIFSNLHLHKKLIVPTYDKSLNNIIESVDHGNEIIEVNLNTKDNKRVTLHQFSVFNKGDLNTAFYCVNQDDEKKQTNNNNNN